MNVQAVCDANLKFQNVVARWAGSTHDQTIFGHSTLHEQLSAGQFGECVLIGDCGYANTSFLCTPYSRRERPNPQDYSAADHEYQRAILTTRNTVERAFGLLKRRFPILHSGMQLQRVEVIQQMVMTCCILHNICIDAGDLAVDDFADIPTHIPAAPADNENENEPVRGGRARRVIVPKAREVIVRLYEQRLAQNIHVPNAQVRDERRRARRAQQ